MPQKKKAKAKRRERKSVPVGKAYIQSTFNNTIVTLTDPQGNVIAWGSSGTAGFKGSRKGTPYAAQLFVLSKVQVFTLLASGIPPPSHIMVVAPLKGDGCRREEKWQDTQEQFVDYVAVVARSFF